MKWFQMVKILVILTLVGDNLHLLAPDIPFKYDPNNKLGDMIYYLTTQFGSVTFFPSVFMYLAIPKKQISARYMAFTLLLYTGISLFKEICYACGVGYYVFGVDVLYYGQTLGMVTVLILATVGYYSWKY